MKPLSRSYYELAAAYETSQSEEVRNVTFRYRDIFVRDTNLGLVKQVCSLYTINNVKFYFPVIRINPFIYSPFC